MTDQTDLIIKDGQTKKIFPRLYRYGSVLIEEGGTLELVDGAEAWFVIWATGKVEVHGEIVGRQFRRFPSVVTAHCPDGRRAEHTYQNIAIGGFGGNGGYATHPRHGTAVGGKGAAGSVNWGGGGGSGGGLYFMGEGSRLGPPGNDGSEWRAGATVAYGSPSNGNGGVSREKGNGAPLLLYCPGGFDGAGGRISLRGENGPNGQDAGSTCDTPYRGLSRGGSGGGGGAPGCDGGALIIVASEFGTDPDISIEGGVGGSPGEVGGQCRHPQGATAGQRGEDGKSGYLSMQTMKDWEARDAG